MREIDIRRVSFTGSAAPEVSLQRLNTAMETDGITDGVMRSLIQLTTYAHGISGNLPDIPWQHIDVLKNLGFIVFVGGNDADLRLV